MTKSRSLTTTLALSALSALVGLVGCTSTPAPTASRGAADVAPEAAARSTPVAASAASGANAAPTPRYEKVVVRSSASFDFDRDELKPEDGQRILGELGAAGKVTWQTVNATGYTDSVGTPQYNQGLSERRARAVKDYLVGKGVAPDLITTTGRAAADPVASNASDAGRAQNRRTAVEFEGVKAAP